MSRLENWFRKISKQDRLAIEQTLRKISEGDFKGLQLKKLKGYECIYRVRVRNYRIIYFSDGVEIILKSIKKRNESTYRDV